ncbi:MAG: HAD family phosphatase [Lachnospiraceae bacterium]|nr:HAD family phosphatase [Lachnospiraceae bacterium]
MAEIKNLVFDMGNVLLSYRWKEMLEVDRGLPKDRAFETAKVIFKSDIWKSLDRGDITPPQAIEKFKEGYPDMGDDIEWFIHNYQDMPLPREKTWKLVRTLKDRGYRIYILSNYSQELYGMHAGIVERSIGLDGKVVSYEVHQLKPDKEIYVTLMEKYSLIPEECLFFDDLKENVEGAINAGMNSIVVKKEEDINRMLEKIISMEKLDSNNLDQLSQ